MKFRIYWLEYHNPLNWADDEYPEHIAKIYNKYPNITNKERKLMIEYEKGAYERGIKHLSKILPTKSIHPDPNEDDGWVECECEDIFEAPNIEEAKKITSEYDCGDSGIFTVYNMNKEVVFTEEDL